MQNLPLKKILMIAVPVVVLIIAAILVVPMLGIGSGGGSSSRKDHIAFFTDRGELIVSGNNNAKFTIDGDIESYQISLDGSKAVVLVDYSYRNGGDLYYVTTSGAAVIADEVYAYRLADSGNGVVYFTDYDDMDDVATLYLYETSGKKTTLITDDAYYTGDGYLPGVAISPNGKSVGYITDFDSRTSEFTGYIRIDGKTPERIGSETFAVAISDGGKQLYYCKGNVRTYDASLHVRSGRNDIRLIAEVSSITSVVFNKNYSQVLLTAMVDGERRSFISVGGNERERITGAGIRRLVVSRGTQARSYGVGSVGITVYGFSALNSFVAITDDGLAYYNKKLEANKISSSSDNAGSAEISSNGKTLYYINNSGRLSAINPTTPGAERREIDRNVEYFVASTDGKSVYYVNEDEELYYARGNSESKRIADDVLYYSLSISFSGSRVYFLSDYRSSRGGELCFSNNGGVRTRVVGGEDVMNVWVTPANAFFVTNDDALYRSNGNEKFTEYHEEIDSIRKY